MINSPKLSVSMTPSLVVMDTNGIGSPLVFVTIPFKTTCTSEVTESVVPVFSEFLSEQEKKKSNKREKTKPFVAIEKACLIFIILKVIKGYPPD